VSVRDRPCEAVLAIKDFEERRAAMDALMWIRAQPETKEKR